MVSGQISRSLMIGMKSIIAQWRVWRQRVIVFVIVMLVHYNKHRFWKTWDMCSMQTIPEIWRIHSHIWMKQDKTDSLHQMMP